MKRAVRGAEMRAPLVAWCVTMATAVCSPKITTHTHKCGNLITKRERKNSNLFLTAWQSDKDGGISVLLLRILQGSSRRRGGVCKHSATSLLLMFASTVHTVKPQPGSSWKEALKYSTFRHARTKNFQVFIHCVPSRGCAELVFLLT